MKMNSPEIIFPNLGIEFGKVNEVAFSLFGIDIYWYGIFICFGFIGGWGLVSSLAKKTKQDPNIYAEFLIWAMISAIVGARAYYVLSSWDEYKDNLLGIFKIRDGGLAVYGGVIMSCIALAIFTKIKKLNFWMLADTASVGVFVGQILGRMGNFFNKECFGGYSDGLFAMAIKKTDAKYVPDVLMDKLVLINGIEYLQVHPMFLYEMTWNIVMLLLVLLYFNRRRFNGEIFALYFLLYGLGRVWIESMRTDQLLIGNTDIPISVVMSIIFIVTSLTFIVVGRKKAKANNVPYPDDIIKGVAI